MNPICTHYIAGQCYSCGKQICINLICKKRAKCKLNQGATIEHIPPESFFKQHVGLNDIKSIPNKDDIIVPACFECNNSASKWDELFTVFITIMSADRNNLATKVLEAKKLKPIYKNQKIINNINTNMRSGTVIKTSSGVVLGSTSTCNMWPDARTALNKTLIKIIRGIYYIETKKVLRDNIAFLHSNKLLKKETYTDNGIVFLLDKSFKDIISELLRGNRVLDKQEGIIKIFNKSLQNGVFKYSFVIMEPKSSNVYKNIGLFLLTFYDNTHFLYYVYIK